MTDLPHPLPRLIPLPEDLTGQELDAIEEAVFYPSHPQPSDVLFVFGYTADNWSHVAGLFKAGMAPLVVATGLYGAESASKERPQAHVIRDALVAHGIPASSILVEDRSTNTGENVLFGKRVLEEAGVRPRSILFVSMAHHSGRCYRTLKKHFPDVSLSCFTVDAERDSVMLSRGVASASRSTIAGLRRIRAYSALWGAGVY